MKTEYGEQKNHLHYCSYSGNRSGGSYSAVIKRNSNTILNQNVEALMDKPVIGTGRICMLQDVLEWCIYLFPYEEYQGIFVSDPIVPEDEERD